MLPRIFSEIVNGIWAIEKSYADSYIPLITSLLNGGAVIENKSNEEFTAENEQKKNLRYFAQFGGVYRISEYGEAAPPEQAPLNSIAIIDIIDVISKYDTVCGPSGTQTKSNILKRAEANPNIKGILLNFDSPGGEGYAALALSETIKSMGKPIISFIDDLAASAAYWLASATNYIVANSPVAKIGSIGTYVTLADYEDFWKNQGIRLISVYADKSTDKNKAYKAALEGDFSLIKKDLNRFNDIFINSIATSRDGKLSDQKEWSTGKLFDADEAMNLGLIDDISTLDETITSFANNLNL
jgi:signal peptide peptidase SppA